MIMLLHLGEVSWRGLGRRVSLGSRRNGWAVSINQQAVEFLIPADGRPEQILKNLSDVLTLSDFSPQAFDAVFSDTADWRLYRAGGYMVTRKAGRKIETVWRDRSDGTELARWAVNCPRFVWELPKGLGRDALEPVVAMRALLPMAEVSGTAWRAAMLNADVKTVARLEAVAFSDKLNGDGFLPGRLRLLPVRGYDKEFGQALAAIKKKTGLKPLESDPATVLFEALGLDFGSDPNKISIEFDLSMEAGVAMKTVLLRLLEIIEGNTQGIIDDVDTEFLHEFRVAVRRSRSALVPFKDCFAPKSFKRFSDDLAWLGRDTGDPRDLDVWLLKFPDYKAMLPDEVKPQLDPLEGFLKKKRNAAYAQLRRDLKSKRYHEFLRDWRAFLASGVSSDDERPMARKPVMALADKWIGKFYKRLIKEGSVIGSETPAEALHELRKTCKKFRYQIDFFGSLYPKEKFKVAAKELKRLQENLGDFQDLEVQADSLRGFASEMIEKGGKEGEVYLAMGMLVSDLLQRQAEARAEFSERFDRFAGQENRALFTELFIERNVQK